MSAEKATRDMLLACLSLLQDRDPVELAAALKRFGFAPGDVTFHRRRQPPHLSWTTVHRWPWESSLAAPYEPECPGPDCLMCNGEACNLCGAGCWNNAAPHCDHASDERHQEPPNPLVEAAKAIGIDLRQATEARAANKVRASKRSP